MSPSFSAAAGAAWHRAARGSARAAGAASGRRRRRRGGGGGGGKEAAAALTLRQRIRDPGAAAEALGECACALHLRGRDGASRLRPLPLPPALIPLPCSRPRGPSTSAASAAGDLLCSLHTRLGLGWASPGYPPLGSPLSPIPIQPPTSTPREQGPAWGLEREPQERRDTRHAQMERWVQSRPWVLRDT